MTENNPKKNVFLVWSKKKGRYFPDIHTIANKLIELYNPRTIYGKKSEEIWRYDEGIWKNDARELLSVKVEDLIGSYAKNNVISEVLGKIKRQTNISREEFENKDAYLIPLENGVYSLKSNKLISYKPKHYFKFFIPVEYNESAECENFLNFLDEVLYPDDVSLMQELFGFCLFREYFLKKAFIWLGDKDTSKTTLLNILIAFVGEKNKTGLPLQKITGGNDFSKLALKNKLLNAYDDLAYKDLSDAGGFKVATGGGYVSGEEKFGDFVQFKNYAKHCFTANKIPVIKDNTDDAYFSRWIVICFDNIVKKKNPFILKKLITPEELSGIFNWALEGFKRLFKNKKFNYLKTSEETKTLMERSSTPLVAFVEDCLIEKERGTVTKEKMYQVYSSWASKKNKPKFSKAQLGRQLPIYAKYTSPKKGKERHWASISVKKEWRIPEKEKSTEEIPKSEKNNDDKGEVGTLGSFKNVMSDIVEKEVSPEHGRRDIKKSAHSAEKEDVNEEELKEVLEDFEDNVK